MISDESLCSLVPGLNNSPRRHIQSTIGNGLQFEKENALPT